MILNFILVGLKQPLPCC